MTTGRKYSTYVYFDNDAKGHALKNATRLKELLTKLPDRLTGYFMKIFQRDFA
jgi:uncharacterized protein YecE (DUF72 family)